MNSIQSYIKNTAITVTILATSFLINELFQYFFNTNEHVASLFIFAVFLISLLSDGYIYGIVSAFLVVIINNYVFTPPVFVFTLNEMVHLMGSILLIIIAVLTCMLTVKIKKHEKDKIEHEKEKMRANLLRAISHDLRTPLTNISGSASVLLENSKNLTNEQQKKLLLGIQEDSNWLVHMVENLLSITRIDNGQLQITKQTIVLDELIGDVLLKFKKQYPNQKIDLQLPEDIILIPMDVLLIEQVLLNILENAMKHAKNMTKLSLRVYEQEGKAIFEIEDNGCGLSNNQLKHMFQGYYESENHPSDGKNRNMGIGMSVCATIIKAHDGEIMVENVKTGGTRFRFTLLTEESIDE